MAHFHKSTSGLVLALVLLASAGCEGPQLSATPNLYVGSDVNPFEHVPPELQTTTVEVVYATDRVPAPLKDGTLKYGYGRSKSPVAGTVTVQIGKDDLDWDTLVEQSRISRRTVKLPLKVVEINELIQFPEFPIPPLAMGPDGVIEQPALLEARAEALAALHELLDDRIAKAPRKHAFLYVHGYNNTFDFAAIRMAQLFHLGGRGGVPILYSWPAGRSGLLRGYNYDRESGEFTVYHLKKFIQAVAASPQLERLHIIAHSRGTDVTTTALRELNIEYRAAGLDPRKELKLANLVLAAADIDFEVAQQRIGAERMFVADRLTVYLSQEDKAIGIADWLFGSTERLGRLKPEDMTPAQREMLRGNQFYQFIDVDAKTSGVGHAYFVDNPAVFSDMILMLRDDLDAGPESGRPMEQHPTGFWVIKDGYPNASAK